MSASSASLPRLSSLDGSSHNPPSFALVAPRPSSFPLPHSSHDRPLPRLPRAGILAVVWKSGDPAPSLNSARGLLCVLEQVALPLWPPEALSVLQGVVSEFCPGLLADVIPQSGTWQGPVSREQVRPGTLPSQGGRPPLQRAGHSASVSC